MLHILGLVKSLADDLVRKSRTGEQTAQGQGNAEQRIHGGEEGNLAGVLGGFHRHVEELLLRHAALRSLAPADFDSTPTASSNSGRSLQLLGYNTGKQACMYYKRNGYGALVGLETVP